MNAVPLLPGPIADGKDSHRPESQSDHAADNAQQRQGNTESKRHDDPRRTPYVPNEEDLLGALNLIAAMALAGQITPAQANAARGCIEAQLRRLDKESAKQRSQPSSQPIDKKRVRELLLENPLLLDVLHSLLSDEVVNQLMSDEE
jgi:hypothetical protein